MPGKAQMLAVFGAGILAVGGPAHYLPHGNEVLGGSASCFLKLSFELSLRFVAPIRPTPLLYRSNPKAKPP